MATLEICDTLKANELKCECLLFVGAKESILPLGGMKGELRLLWYRIYCIKCGPVSWQWVSISSLSFTHCSIMKCCTVTCMVRYECKIASLCLWLCGPQCVRWSRHCSCPLTEIPGISSATFLSVWTACMWTRKPFPQQRETMVKRFFYNNSKIEQATVHFSFMLIAGCPLLCKVHCCHL